MNMNNNHERFHWHLSIHLRSIFRTIFLDVDEKPAKYSIGFVAIVLIFVITDIGAIYAYLNAESLSISPVFAIGTFFCGWQVSKYVYLHIYSRKIFMSSI